MRIIFPAIIAILASISSCFADITPAPDLSLDMLITQSSATSGFVYTGAGSMKRIFTTIDTTSAKAREYARECLSDKDCIYMPIRTERLQYSFKGKQAKLSQKYTIYRTGPDMSIPYHMYRRYAFNGEKTDIIFCDTSHDSGRIIPFGYVGADKCYALKNQAQKIVPTYNTCDILGLPVHVFLAGGDNEITTDAITIQGSETIDGDACVVVTGTIKSKTTFKSDITVWLNPRHFYWPKRIELFNGDEKTIVNNTMQIINGAPFLKVRTTDIYTKDDNGSELVHDSRDTLAVESDFVINIPINDGEFALDFPPGLKVTDIRINRPVKNNHDISETEG